MFLSIGTGRLDRLLAHARQGGVTPPVDGRSAHPSREDDKSPEWFDADSWFCWAYHNIAEFIATMRMQETSLKAIEDLIPELSPTSRRMASSVGRHMLPGQILLLPAMMLHNSSVTSRSSR